MVSNDELMHKLAAGFVVETEQDMSEDYHRLLIQTLTITADTELISIFSILDALKYVPTLNRRLTELAIIQDELGHAHIAYRLLKHLGVDVDALIYERDASEFRNPYLMDLKLQNYAELLTLHALLDRAGYVLLGDIFHHTSYGPWKRALTKVDAEEGFHVRNGESGLRLLVKTDEGRAAVQAAVDWMFVMGLDFFGMADHLKKRSLQLDLHLKGETNDQMRQRWMKSTVRFLDSIQIRTPVHWDPEQDAYLYDFPYPCQWDEAERRWRFDQPIEWSQVLSRFKRHGPYRREYVQTLRQGRETYQKLLREGVA
ncbi:MAG: phenylacetic acid catabolic [Sulfobacillus acidophilus]|uniref:Phenylacetic acid catabolic n=1 Tax=Sulfobacillus acidophilus TaxID=53633 RepID=A0A2T2WHF2_9FIRM|nr:MAG: phenylacetic acid catabolic [Sulfobacillus acidophilus]